MTGYETLGLILFGLLASIILAIILKDMDKL